ncbi:MAG: hypothetical protein IT373_34690 [Polyangiaceae bacterium]|nr:hypothetical protein [Polyangiaceae bacterium]
MLGSTADDAEAVLAQPQGRWAAVIAFAALGMLLPLLVALEVALSAPSAKLTLALFMPVGAWLLWRTARYLGRVTFSAGAHGLRCQVPHFRGPWTVFFIPWSELREVRPEKFGEGATAEERVARGASEWLVLQTDRGSHEVPWVFWDDIEQVAEVIRQRLLSSQSSARGRLRQAAAERKQCVFCGAASFGGMSCRRCGFVLERGDLGTPRALPPVATDRAGPYRAPGTPLRRAMLDSGRTRLSWRRRMAGGGVGGAAAAGAVASLTALTVVATAPAQWWLWALFGVAAAAAVAALGTVAAFCINRVSVTVNAGPGSNDDDDAVVVAARPLGLGQVRVPRWGLARIVLDARAGPWRVPVYRVLAEEDDGHRVPLCELGGQGRAWRIKDLIEGELGMGQDGSAPARGTAESRDKRMTRKGVQ